MHKSTLLQFLILFFIFLLSGCAPAPNNADMIHLRQLKNQAFAGDPESQYQLGIHYTVSNQWNWNKNRGHNWFMDAAEAGHVDAQYMVGMDKLLGRGTSKDTPGALKWLSLAAGQGHQRSQYQLGLAYLNGNGTEKDQMWGRHWLEQAASSNHSEAQFLLAVLFRQGIGGHNNLTESWAWLQRAEQNGQKDAGTALQKLNGEISKNEKDIAKQLATTIETPESKGLYTKPKVRYVQTVLNR
ncbi:MAG: sel1 repeat family protein, partial [Desulfuromusa sp.]|nr:sel1 repeat family protein [Desulfuromusa sp.]